MSSPFTKTATSKDDALLRAYLDISHALMALEYDAPHEIDVNALSETLADIREVYTGEQELRHERDVLADQEGDA